MAVEQIQDHTFLGDLVDESQCRYLYGTGGVCGRPKEQHLIALGGHPWYGRGAEGGSNTPCSMKGCGELRLAKVHAGYSPIFSLPETAMPTSFTPAPEAVIVFGAYSEAVLDLIRKKDAAYGGAWQKQGYMGNLARIQSKTERLKSMMWRDDPDGYHRDDMVESIEDTLKDLMALCAFMGANIEDGNRWGR